MKKISIEITKAQIKCFTIKYTKDCLLPDVEVCISLQTPNGKEISTYDVSTCHWNDSQKIDISHNIYAALPAIERELEQKATVNCKANLKLLEAPKEVIK